MAWSTAIKVTDCATRTPIKGATLHIRLYSRYEQQVVAESWSTWTTGDGTLAMDNIGDHIEVVEWVAQPHSYIPQAIVRTRAQAAGKVVAVCFNKLQVSGPTSPPAALRVDSFSANHVSLRWANTETYRQMHVGWTEVTRRPGTHEQIELSGAHTAATLRQGQNGLQLTPGHTYHFKVQGYSSRAGWSRPWTTIEWRYPVPPAPPPPPPPPPVVPAWARAMRLSPAAVDALRRRTPPPSLMLPPAGQRSLPWGAVRTFAEELGRVDAVSLIQSNYGTIGNLEAVARVGDRLYHYWRQDHEPWTWRPTSYPTAGLAQGQIAAGVAGTPALIQSSFGTMGDFELVVPSAQGGLIHLTRPNPGNPWSQPRRFAEELGRVDAVSLIQGNFGTIGNLEVVARVGDRLYHYWREDQPPYAWRGTRAPGPRYSGHQIASGVTGNPVLLQEQRFGIGYFEVAVPATDRGVIRLRRFHDGTAPEGPGWNGLNWSTEVRVLPDLGRVEAMSMIQSTFGGNLELMARVGDRIVHYWNPWGRAQWTGTRAPAPELSGHQVAAGVTGNPVVIQSRHGHQGNFELVVPRSDRGLLHRGRANDR